MAQLNPLAIDHAEHCRLHEKDFGSVGMSRTQPKQAGGLVQARKSTAVVVAQPAVEGAYANSLERKEQSEGGDLAQRELGIRMFGHVGIDLNEQRYDTVVRKHANLHR